MTSVITTSITGVKSCKYQYFTERASRVLFGHNQPRSAGVIRSIKTLHIELSYRVTPCIWSLIKRLISNIYIKVHWHGTTEKPKVRNGAGLFKYKSTHCIYLISWLIWGLSGTLIYHCHTGRPVPCIAHTTNQPYDGTIIQRRRQYILKLTRLFS